MSVANFPGHRAGASLKPLGGALQQGFLLGNFPGHRAGASLKPDILDLLPPGVTNFPGHRAGASLK